MRRALTLGPVLVVGACSLTTDLDGLSGGVRDGGSAPPAGSDGGAPKDAASDAPVVIVVDDGGGSDAGAPACPQKLVTLCEDFSSDERKNGWTVTASNGASIAVATVPWGERGLLVTAPKATGVVGPTAFWDKKFDPTVSKSSLDVDLQYDQYPSNSGEFHNTFAVRIDHGDTYNILYLSIGVGVAGWAIQDFPVHDGNLEYHIVPVSPGARHHVHFDVEAGGRSRFAVDGVVQSDNPTPAYVLAGRPSLGVGMSVTGSPSTPMTIGYGHLVFTAE